MAAYTLGTEGEPDSNLRAVGDRSICWGSKANGLVWANHPVIVGTSVEMRSLRTYINARPGRTKQILEGSSYIKVQVHRLHVHRTGSAILVIVEHHQSAGLVSDLRDGAYLGTKTIFETDMRERHDERIAVDHLFVIDGRNAIAFRTHKLHIGAAGALCEPDMAHGWKLELAHHHFVAFAENSARWQCC